MSYDLYLFSQNAEFNKASFEAYFGGRARYRLEDGQAWYENEDTGVYFSFDLPSPNDKGDLDEKLAGHALMFNLNLCRPSFFALEAARELAAGARQHNLKVVDPQSAGERRDFDEKEFVQSWRESNQKAIAVLRRSQPEIKMMELSELVLKTAWEWNYTRSDAQAALGEDIFVPKIMFVHWRGRPATATVWTDAIPVLLPQTDIVLVYRDTLARRRWLRRQPDVVSILWSDIERELLPFSRAVREHGNDALLYESESQSVTSFVRGLKQSSEKVEGIPMDHLCDAIEGG